MWLLDLLGLGPGRDPQPRPAANDRPSPVAPVVPDPPVAPDVPDRVEAVAAPADERLSAAHEALDAYAAELLAAGRVGEADPRQVEAGRRILEARDVEQARVVMAALERFGLRSGGGAWAEHERYTAPELVSLLLGTELPLAVEELARVVDGMTAGWEVPLGCLVPALRHRWRDPGAREVLAPAAARLDQSLRRRPPSPEHRQALDDLCWVRVYGPQRWEWADHVVAEVAAMDDEARPRWKALRIHFREATGARPSARWLKKGRLLRAEVGAEAFRARVAGWLARIGQDADGQLPAASGDMARGVAWLLADGGGAAEARVLGDLALAAAKPVAGKGIYSPKVLNACLASLGGMEGDEPLAQLSRLRARIRQAHPQGQVAAALRAGAERRGIEPDELEELVVPTFGMEEPGVLREEMGGWTAEVLVTGTAQVEAAWIRADGKRQKGVPAEVRAAHPDAVKELKASMAEMEKMLAAQRDRLEALPMAGRVLPFGAWRERYLDHPLLAALCRRLVWRFDTEGGAASGAWLDGAIVDAGDAPLPGLGQGTTVRPWHPIDATVDEVRAWREWLDRHRATQPFRQAHREVYPLTDAERATGSYSNRFAAHLLKQHQFAALAKGRGWRYHLSGGYDSDGSPTLRLERHGLVAEYVVVPVHDNDGWTGFMARYVSTDRVRFTTLDGEPVMLEEVPPLVLSEVMRDVDLFVGVASVGADPDWEGRNYHDSPWATYWQDYSTAAPSGQAETRRDVLERLLPRLKIASRCSLDDRNLVVRGELRTYRIHLGSGNIFMEPNNQYLCIVPQRGQRRTPGIVLPFEGDAMLAIILSKAFLLADDTRITDPVILEQLNR